VECIQNKETLAEFILTKRQPIYQNGLPMSCFDVNLEVTNQELLLEELSLVIFITRTYTLLVSFDCP
jgi:hypothetical protein